MKHVIKIVEANDKALADALERELKALSGPCYICERHLDLTIEDGIWAGKAFGAVHIACWESLKPPS